jgi:GT2 family glycosyltransferase
MNVSQQLVSVVIPVFNHYDYTRACLETVQRLRYPMFETIVVDNGSTDDTSDRLSSDFDWVDVVHNDENLGYAAGCNLGIRRSRGDLILLLNNDTLILDEDLLQVASLALKRDARIGAIGFRLVDYDKQDVTVYDGVNAPGFWYARSKRMKTYRGISGPACMLRRSALEDVGLLDEGLFIYFEETDLIVRMQDAGWKLEHISSVRVAHKGSVTALGLGSPTLQYYTARNFVVFLRRHSTPGHVLFRVAPKWALETVVAIKRMLADGHQEALCALLGGYFDGAKRATRDQPTKGPPLQIATQRQKT